MVNPLTNKLLLLNLVWFSLLLQSGSAQAAWAADPEQNKQFVDCLVIEQIDEKSGHNILYLGKEKACITNMNGRVTAVTSAPQWNVVTHNKDKSSITLTADQWYKSGFTTRTKDKRNSFIVNSKNAKAITFMGYKALEIVKNTRQDSLKEGVESLYRSSVKDKSSAMRGKSYAIYSAAFKLSPAVDRFMQGYFGTTALGSVELEVTKQVGTTTSIALKTLSIKQAKVPSSQFEIPKGLKLVNDMRRVVTGQEFEQLFLEMSGATK